MGQIPQKNPHPKLLMNSLFTVWICFLKNPQNRNNNKKTKTVGVFLGQHKQKNKIEIYCEVIRRHCIHLYSYHYWKSKKEGIKVCGE